MNCNLAAKIRLIIESERYKSSRSNSLDRCVGSVRLSVSIPLYYIILFIFLLIIEYPITLKYVFYPLMIRYIVESR